jgi:hypothetical protein
VRHLELAPLRNNKFIGDVITGGRRSEPTARFWLSPPRLHLWEDPTGEAPLADDNKVSCCSTIWCSVA